jgi:hypothetical protein
MLSVNFPAGFNRLNPGPLDISSVFDNTAALSAYLTPPTAAYPGQVVAVRTAGVPNLFVIDENLAYTPIEGGMGIVGMFWIEQDTGDLYFVSDVGVRNPFEIDNGYLYYIMPGV